MRFKAGFISIVMVASVSVVGCASLDDQMKRYVGQHRSELINNWGPPSEETKLKKGGTRIVYYEQNPLIHPNQIVNPALMNCEKVFITDSDGIIKSYSHENCG